MVQYLNPLFTSLPLYKKFEKALAPVATAGTYASLTDQPTQLSQFTNNINTFATLTTPGTLNVTGASTLAATSMTSNAISGNETVTGNLNVAGTTNLAATTINGLTLTGGVTGTPLNGVYNGNTAITNSKIWYGKGTTTSGQALIIWDIKKLLGTLLFNLEWKMFLLDNKNNNKMSLSSSIKMPVSDSYLGHQNPFWLPVGICLPWFCHLWLELTL